VNPAELLKQLVRFDTTNPPGREADCIGFLREHLQAHGVDSRLFARDPERPNLLARVRGRGEAPPLLLYGHVDVVPTADQDWSADPFAADERDGYLWGRGTIDMKGGVAMLTAAFLRAATAPQPPPGDLLLCVVSDEEAGSVFGARFLVEEHAREFDGIRHALGEFGGFSMHLAGHRFFPIMVAEKQALRVKATLRGPGGHGSMPLRGGAMARLGAMLTALDSSRLPVHVTPAVRTMVQAIAAALDEGTGALVRGLLDPAATDATLDALGAPGRTLDALLHNTVNATIVHGGSKVNVIPGAIEVELDGRILPGQAPEDLLRELHELLGPEVQLDYDQFDPGPPEVDLSAFDVLAGVLRDAEPDATPIPLVLSGVTDARFFCRLGIQTYGFLPMRFPAEIDFISLIHAADERVPVGEVAWGADRISEAIARYRG
jgi:acetylornithine deacetylase/succinyl-diaminopimelate desuccinylase-like protein